MPWFELVSVVAHYFNEGDKLCTRNHECCSDPWWQESDSLLVASDGRDLKSKVVSDYWCFYAPCDCISFEFIPIPTRRGDVDRQGLIEYALDEGTFMDGFDSIDLINLFGRVRGTSNDHMIALVTIWRCDAGRTEDNWMGPGEYFEEWDLVACLDDIGIDSDLRPFFKTLT